MSKNFEERWEKIGKDLEALGEKAKSAVGDAQAARELGQEVLEAKIKDAKGDIVALQENARIKEEEKKNHLFSQMLKAQMTIKARIEDLKNVRDKNRLEGYIDAHIIHLADLYDTISYLLVDLELTTFETSEALEEYNQKYGEKEEA